VFSLNVPVPGRVARVASDLAPALAGFEEVRDRHTLVLKRFGEVEPARFPRIRQRARAALADTAPFEARITHIGLFEQPTIGAAPVVYLGVESEGLQAAHRRLTETFDVVEGFEGDGYVPHVTVARGGDREAARALTDREIEPVAWTVSELVFRKGKPGRGGSAGRVELSGAE
jgi:2'-5' RNA ligase